MRVERVVGWVGCVGGEERSDWLSTIIIIIIIIIIILIIIIIIITMTAAGLRINYNVAFNQPAIQYSTYVGPYMASYAVDGNRVNTLSSTYGNSGQNEWWAVDLGRPTYIGNVTITPCLVSCFPGNIGNLYLCVCVCVRVCV